MVRAKIEDEGKITIANGVDIYIDPGFNPYRYVVQFGEIVACPMKVDKDFVYDEELKVGDKIWMHHFCISKETAQVVNGEILYAVKYRDIYCREEKDGSITPVQDYVFLTPVLEDESACKTGSGLWIKSEPEPIPLVGRMEAIPKSAKDAGFNIGYHVRFLRNSDYDIKINGKLYYRMKYKRIIALMETQS